MRPDRIVATACVAALALLSLASDVHAGALAIGKPAHLAHHGLGGYDTCGIRDGDAILTVARERLYWIDGATGAIRRSVKLPGDRWRHSCAIASVDVATTHGFVIASDAGGFGELDVMVVSPTGAVKAHRTVPGHAGDVVDLVTVGETVFVGPKSRLDPVSELHALSTRTLDVEHTYRLPRIAALVRRGADAVAILRSGEAFALRDTAVATKLDFPRLSDAKCAPTLPSQKTPVRLAGGLYAALECTGRTDGGVLRVRRDDGSIVAERAIGAELLWYFAQESTVVPWEDGVRILATSADSDSLHVLCVPISATP